MTIPGRIFRVVAPFLLLAAVAVNAQEKAPQSSTAQQPPVPSAASFGSAGIGDLLVAPPRLIFEGRERSGELSLVNTGSKAATYRISLVNISMGSDGNLKQVDKPSDLEVLEKSLVRYSPRQVTLEPRVAQSIRIELRKPADLAEGEYRIHMLFQGVPPTDVTGGSVDPNDESSKQIRIALVPVYGVSIPLFIRHGATQASASISELKMETDPDGQIFVSMRLSRTGNRSVYGNVQVTFVAPPQRPQVIAIANGVAVYREIDSRPVRLPIHLPEGVTLTRGRIHVTYTDAERDDRPLLAESELIVP